MMGAPRSGHQNTKILLHYRIALIECFPPHRSIDCSCKKRTFDKHTPFVGVCLGLKVMECHHSKNCNGSRHWITNCLDKILQGDFFLRSFFRVSCAAIYFT